MTSEQLSRIVLVLDHPKDLVNIAGVVRVMMNFGLTRLRIVRPDVFDAYRIGGIAHRSSHVVDATTMHETLEDAVADATFVLGTTARARTAGRTYVRPREAARRVVEASRSGCVAIVFGREDRGLTNHALDLCHAVSIVPTDQEHSSLNLAQAALVHAYEVFVELDVAPEELPKGRRATRSPTQQELEETYAALEDGLTHIDFFKAREPRAVMRTLRTLIARAAPDLRESRLIAAVGYEIGHYLDRSEREG